MPFLWFCSSMAGVCLGFCATMFLFPSSRNGQKNLLAFEAGFFGLQFSPKISGSFHTLDPSARNHRGALPRYWSWCCDFTPSLDANWSFILPNWGKSQNSMIMIIVCKIHMIVWISILYTGTKCWLIWSYGFEIEITDSHRYINVIARVRYLDPEILKDS